MKLIMCYFFYASLFTIHNDRIVFKKNSSVTHYSYSERDKVKSNKKYVFSNLPTIKVA